MLLHPTGNSRSHPKRPEVSGEFAESAESVASGGGNGGGVRPSALDALRNRCDNWKRTTRLLIGLSYSASYLKSQLLHLHYGIQIKTTVKARERYA